MYNKRSFNVAKAMDGIKVSYNEDVVTHIGHTRHTSHVQYKHRVASHSIA